MISETYDIITLMFSDIPEFINLVVSQPPLVLTTYLMDIDVLFHHILQQYDVHLIEAISDSYMVTTFLHFYTSYTKPDPDSALLQIASGVPEPNGVRNVQQICLVARELISKSDASLPLRIGVHSGERHAYFSIRSHFTCGHYFQDHAQQA